MKSHKILAAIGYVVIVLGLGALVYEGFIASGSGESSMTIPAGEGYFASFQTKSSMWMNAHLDGTVEVQGAGTTDVFVLDSAQYEEYAYDLEPTTSLWSSHGSGGTFSVDLPGTGRYYIVANHGADSASVDQTVTLSYTISGINLLYVIVGAVMMAIGIALSVVSLRMKKKEKGPAIPLATASPAEVKMFDNKEKLQ